MQRRCTSPPRWSVWIGESCASIPCRTANTKSRASRSRSACRSWRSGSAVWVVRKSFQATGHQEAVQRLAEVPGLGVDSAQQIIAEVGPTAATFPSEKCLSSWVGACPGDEESAGVNYSHRSPQGNRHMRRVLNQAANASARTKGSIFEMVYRRSVPRLGHNQAIGAIAHRQCRLIWLILHQGVRYEERGPAVTKKLKQKRTARMIRQLRSLGYRIELSNPQQPGPAQAP